MAYRMAYIKANYPKEFMSLLLTNVIGQEEKTKKYIDECKKMDINILKPNINLSNYEYNIEEDGIRFSLSSIKNVGSITSKDILNIRSECLFKDYFDFISRTNKIINKKIIESLIDSGSLDLFGYNHNTLNTNIDNALNYGDLFNSLDESIIEKPIIEELDEYSKEELSNREVSVFGFYLTNHPVTNYKAKYDNVINTNDIKNYFNKEVNMVLLIDYIKEINTKNNKKMAFLKCSDEFGSIDLVVFPNFYEELTIENKNIIYISGNVEKNMSRYQIVVSNLKKI